VHDDGQASIRSCPPNADYARRRRRQMPGQAASLCCK
jgi:hypothetical protein